MATHYVTAYSSALNLRSSPKILEDNIIGSLFLSQPVNVTGGADDQFVACEAWVDEKSVSGFVSSKYLRPETTPNREALLAQVYHEYTRFQRGMGREHVHPFSSFVGEMWTALGSSNLDGTDRDVPWSAAAISFMVRNAGPAYSGFKFAAAHSKFTHHAIKARELGNLNVPFWGYRLFERRPHIGDIIVRDNPTSGPAVDFDIARQISDYRSHSDIIVHIDSAAQKVIAIGGNVSDSVSIAFYDLEPSDFISSKKNAFALLVNRTDDA